MRVLIVSGYGGAVDLQAPAIGAAFRRLGWKVSFFAYQSGFEIRRPHRRYDWFSFASLLPGANRILNRMLAARCRRERPDLLFVCKGETLLPGVVRGIRSLGTKTAHFTSDDPLGRHHPANRIRNLDEYDWLFVYDRDPARRLRESGLPAFYLPASAPEIFTPDPAVPKDLALTFIGQYSARREATLAPLVPMGLRVWGNGWGACENRLLKRRHSREFSRERKLIELYRRSRVTVNVHDLQSVESTNFRTFEAAACGTLCLTEHNPELANLFDVGREIVTWTDAKDLVEKTRHYLAHPEEAARIAQAGRLRVDAEHRTFRRIEAVDRIARGGAFRRDLPLEAQRGRM